MALCPSALLAEDVAAGFTTFRDPLPEHAAEVTSLISDLYNISASLACLDNLDRDPRYRCSVAEIQPELKIVRASLKYTLEDIVDFFRALDGGEASAAGYNSTWLTLNHFFWEQSRYSLATRLAQYKTMLKEIIDSTKNNRYDSPLFVGHLNSIKALLSAQDARLASRMEHMSLGRNPSSSSNNAGPSKPVGERRPRRRVSYERTRPAHTSSTVPRSPSSGTFSDFPPSVSDAPPSPAATSRSGVSDVIKEHWAKQSFKAISTNTPLPGVYEMSKCREKPQPGMKTWLRESGFQPVLQLSLNDQSDMRVSFWLRARDHRVYILCRVPSTPESSDYWSMPLNELAIMRGKSCLLLCRRRDGSNEPILWTRLKFTTMEDLVVFHNTFLALRSQDLGHPVKRILDDELDGELELFSGLIIDDGYKHALRVFEDSETGAVRLQASVRKGDTKRTPVWTAFVTTQIRDRKWLKYQDSHKVALKNTKPVIFMSENHFLSPQTAQGFLTLDFEDSFDAEEFVRVMDELAKTGRR